MLNQDIPDEFYKTVDTVARKVQTKFVNLDWEDIRQDIWVDMLQQNEVYDLVVMDNPEGILYRKATRVATAASYGDEISWGAYKYSVRVVRKMLEGGFLADYDQGTLSEQEDLRVAFGQLEASNSRYANLVYERYINDIKPENRADTDALQRAVTRLTTLMNRSWVKMSTRSHFVDDENTHQVYEIDSDEILDRIDNERKTYATSR